jgi:hypothetical protein
MQIAGMRIRLGRTATVSGPHAMKCQNATSLDPLIGAVQDNLY